MNGGEKITFLKKREMQYIYIGSEVRSQKHGI